MRDFSGERGAWCMSSAASRFLAYISLISLMLLAACGQNVRDDKTSEASSTKHQALSVQPVAKPARTTPPTTVAPPAGKQTVWVVMKQQASLAQAKTVKDWKARGQAVYNALTTAAKNSQASLTASL